MKHLACIMDGNRRWAKNQFQPSFFGHRAGAQTIKTVAQFCIKEKIQYLSLYAFSLENFNRSGEEKTYIFDLIAQISIEQIASFKQENIRISFVGDRSYFPAQTTTSIETIERETKECSALCVQILFCYGARQEIVQAARVIGTKMQQGLLTEKDITEELFTDHLWTRGIPEPDLIVRTGGAIRLSNFLLYQAAYSEFYFLDCFWPDITETHLRKAIDYFHSCKRNGGS